MLKVIQNYINRKYELLVLVYILGVFYMRFKYTRYYLKNELNLAILRRYHFLVKLINTTVYWKVQCSPLGEDLSWKGAAASLLHRCYDCKMYYYFISYIIWQRGPSGLLQLLDTIFSLNLEKLLFFWFQ